MFSRILVALALGAAVLSAQSLEQDVREHLLAAQQQRGFPGVSAACVLPDGKVVAVAIGVDGADAPLTTASKLMSGSIGKTYCAAVVLQLVQEKRLALDGKVRDVLGDREFYARVPNAETITIRQLLSHTSGIREHVWKPEFQQAVVQAGDRAMSPEECLTYCLDDEPLFPAGERFSYADTNYLLAGLCAEQVTGKPFAELLQQRVLQPSKLSETIWNDRRELPGLCCGIGSGVAFHKGPTVTDGKYFTNPAFEYCGGGISSTPRDLARWMRELFAGEVVPNALRVDHIRKVKAPRHVSGGYGLGCFTGDSAHGPALGHSGIMPGFLSYALYYPKVRIAVAVQFPTDNMREVGNMRRLVDELAGLAVTAVASSAGKGR